MNKIDELRKIINNPAIDNCEDIGKELSKALIGYIFRDYKKIANYVKIYHMAKCVGNPNNKFDWSDVMEIEPVFDELVYDVLILGILIGQEEDDFVL